MNNENMFYDDSLVDDASHPHVVAARAAGRAWAEREWDALTEEAMKEQRGETWYPVDADAMELVAFDENSTVEDADERAHELASICNAAASETWNAARS